MLRIVAVVVVAAAGTVAVPAVATYCSCVVAVVAAAGAIIAAGHGEHGDVVSHFVMHDLQSRLAAHPTVSEDPGTALKETYIAVDSSLGKLKV